MSNSVLTFLRFDMEFGRLLLLMMRVSYENRNSKLRFYANSASRSDATTTLLPSVQFGYSVWLPLRVFEQRAITGRDASVGECFKQSCPLLVAIASHRVVAPAGVRSFPGGPAGVAHGSLARLRTRLAY